MPIARCSDQGPLTLREYFADVATWSDKYYHLMAPHMITAVELIDRLFPTTQLFGLTSHGRLVLLSHDSSKPPWHIIVSHQIHEYQLEHMLGRNQHPWPGATALCTAKTIDELEKLLVLAMDLTGAWSDNEELKRLILLLDN